MAYTNAKRFERWLRQQAFGWELPLERLIVKHSPQGSRGTKVFEKRLDNFNDDVLTATAEEIYETMAEDANGLGGTQRYVVEAIRQSTEEGKEGNSSGRFSCRIVGNDDEENESDGLDTEGPTSKGMVSQGMRHNEAIMKTFAGTIGVMMGTMQRMVAQQAEQIEKLTEQRYKSLELIEAAATNQSQREIDGMVAASDQERKDKMFEKIMQLAPAVVNRLGGRKLLPEAVTPKEVMLKDLVTSLTPEQFERIGASLQPAQQVAFVQLLQTIQAEEEAGKQSATATPRNGA